MDEEIIFESPPMSKNVIAQPISSSSNDSIKLVDDYASTSLCEVLIVEMLLLIVLGMIVIYWMRYFHVLVQKIKYV